eukprot:TRINITY_DN62585_c0_g1_i1.p1 TRINITY_DN62585_c0_g1~~TRINITY_DN62585_c0_g1_i1.p1  ORF type:complete len:435 (+),score=41.17 TRINITY_DN62585_c0_g1_i1:59-1363(+)
MNIDLIHQHPLLAGASVCGVVVAVSCALLWFRKKCRFHVHVHGPHARVAKIIQKCPELMKEKKFWNATLFCTNKHVQTVWPNIVRRPVAVTYSREYLQLEDGGCLGLDWCLLSGEMPASQPAPSIDHQWLSDHPTIVNPRPPRHTGRDIDVDLKSTISCMADKETTKPIVLLIHGVTGGSRETYITHMVKQAHARGWDAIGLNMRGCGGTPLTSPIAYCAGSSDDLDLIVQYVHRNRPKSPLFAIGVSLGGNVLCKYLGETGKDSPLSAAVALACPFAPLTCIRDLHTRWFDRLIYSRLIAHRLVKFIEKHPALKANKAFATDKKKLITDVWDFDEHMTGPAFGFSGAEEYYTKVASVNGLDKVGIPLLAVNSRDDPLAPFLDEFWHATGDNTHVSMIETQIGGHVGWMQGWSPTTNANWGEVVAFQFLAASIC